MEEDINKIPGIQEKEQMPEAGTRKVYPDSYFLGLLQNLIFSVPGGFIIVYLLNSDWENNHSSESAGLAYAYEGIAVFLEMVIAVAALTVLTAIVLMIVFGLQHRKKAFRANLVLAVVVTLAAFFFVKTII